MKRTIPEALTGLALGEGTILGGARVVRRSLFGFQIDGDAEIRDASATAERLAAAAAVPSPRAARPVPKPRAVGVCFRCAGDGLGRRDRGVCGVCHGRGISSSEPAGGWSAATPAEIATAADQTALALREARHPRARESLAALLSTLAPLRGRPAGELRRTVSEPPPARGVSAA
jgi:hypothetical protein